MPRRVRTVLIVFVCAACAFALRIAISYHAVFDGTAVAFIETDAWYHMRLVDALIRDFPNRVWLDPYLHHPGGELTNVGPFFDWVIAAAALLLGGGSPSGRLVDQVGAVVPVVFGALTTVPVYVLGRELFSRRAGLWAAAIVGVLPGNILKRSLLGFTDHHCAEVFLSSVALMFLILALKGARPQRWQLAYIALSGLALGSYLLTWSGGALLVAVIVIWAPVQMVIERLREQSGTAVASACIPALLVAGCMVLPWASVTRYFAYQMMAIGAGVFVILFLQGLAMATRNVAKGGTIYFATALIAGTAAVLVIGWVARDSVASVLGQLSRFSPGRTGALADEAQALMLSADRRPIPLWNQFTTSLLLGIIGLGALIVDWSRRLSAPQFLFLVWTGGMLVATFGQVRFSYYLAVNVALCAGYACDRFTELTTPRRAGVVAGVGLAAVVLLPNVTIYRDLAPHGPTTAWVDALQWLRSSTPDPFDNPERYYASANAEVGGASPVTSRYGVLNWWDSGYWIIRIGHRVPTANPRQTGAREVAEFLLTEDESDAGLIADRLGTRYVIANWELQARLTRKREVLDGYLKSIADALGVDTDRYIRVAYTTSPRGREPVMLYEPAYYRTMMSRLYRAGFDPAPALAPAWVVTLAEREERGVRFWELVKESSFADYSAAEAVVEAAHSPNVRLVGKDPLVSCVPVEAPREFVNVYRSLEKEDHNGLDGPPVIQIFERARGGAPQKGTR